jgi:hypothetical protein
MLERRPYLLASIAESARPRPGHFSGCHRRTHPQMAVQIPSRKQLHASFEARVALRLLLSQACWFTYESCALLEAECSWPGC